MKIVLTLTCMQPSSSLSSKATFPTSTWFRKRAVPKEISLGKQTYTHIYASLEPVVADWKVMPWWPCLQAVQLVLADWGLQSAQPPQDIARSQVAGGYDFGALPGPLKNNLLVAGSTQNVESSKNITFQCSIKDFKPVVTHNLPTGILSCKVGQHLLHQLPTLLCVGHIFFNPRQFQEGSCESRNAGVILLPEVANLLVKAPWQCGPTRLCHTCLTYPYHPSCAICL